MQHHLVIKQHADREKNPAAATRLMDQEENKRKRSPRVNVETPRRNEELYSPHTAFDKKRQIAADSRGNREASRAKPAPPFRLQTEKKDPRRILASRDASSTTCSRTLRGKNKRSIRQSTPTRVSEDYTQRFREYKAKTAVNVYREFDTNGGRQTEGGLDMSHRRCSPRTSNFLTGTGAFGRTRRDRQLTQIVLGGHEPTLQQR